jgi:hypothetical protein
MPYVQYYLMEIDVSVQSEVDDEIAKRLQAKGIAMMDEPFSGIRIVPRDRSEWPDDLKKLMEPHQGWRHDLRVEFHQDR